MVHKERPYQSTHRRAYNFYPKHDPSKSVGLRVNPDEEDRRAAEEVENYLLHHTLSDRVIYADRENALFD
ncbi:hypothetical protein J4423_00820 [Candidatus Pacearchaeota archaeon]|nr:hypothetical protein [Candidatus Pacearchaeota archaeon]